MSCWVMVEPPKELRSPRNMFAQARVVRSQSTPLWSKKRLSSMATQAKIRSLGISSYLAQMRFSLP